MSRERKRKKKLQTNMNRKVNKTHKNQSQEKEFLSRPYTM